MGKQEWAIGASTFGMCAAVFLGQMLFTGVISPPVAAGNTITHIMEMPADSAARFPKHFLNGKEPIKIGYKHYRLQILWIPFWTSTSKGEFVAYQPSPFKHVHGDIGAWDEPLGTSLEEVSTRTGIRAPELTIPWSARNPWGLYAVIGVLVMGGAVLAVHASVAGLHSKGRPIDNRAWLDVAELFQDARYQQALKVFDEQYARPPAAAEPAQHSGAPPVHEGSRFQAAFAAGVQQLLGVGIPRKKAERDLAKMLQLLDRAGHGLEC